MPSFQKQRSIPPNPWVDNHDLWGIPVVYLFLVLGVWMSGIPLTWYTLLWLAGVTVVMCSLFLLMRSLVRLRRARARE